MALKDVQLFVTKFLRDSELREAVSRDGIKKLASAHGLDEKEQDTILDMDLPYLDKEAAAIIGERFDKREGEFKEFFQHLSMYGPVEDFFFRYDRAYRTGLMTRPIEIDCLLSFATTFVVQNKLPAYLIDLARFNYYYTKVSITAIEKDNSGIDKGLNDGLQLYKIVQLNQPYKIVNFRYDVLSIVRSEFKYNDPQYSQENLVSLFMQKDWNKPTTTKIFYANEIAFLDQLIKEEFSVNELLATYSVQHHDWVINALAHLLENNIISLKSPKHFL